MTISAKVGLEALPYLTSSTLHEDRSVIFIKLRSQLDSYRLGKRWRKNEAKRLIADKHGLDPSQDVSQYEAFFDQSTVFSAERS